MSNSELDKHSIRLPVNVCCAELTPCFSGVRVPGSLVLCVCFVDCYLSFCTFSFGHCVVCSSSVYGFWLPLWYLQIILCYLSFYRNQDADWWNINEYNLNKVMLNALHYMVTRGNISMLINIKPSWLKASIKMYFYNENLMKINKLVLGWWRINEKGRHGFSFLHCISHTRFFKAYRNWLNISLEIIS
jgi:hypothetical protein